MDNETKLIREHWFTEDSPAPFVHERSSLDVCVETEGRVTLALHDSNIGTDAYFQMSRCPMGADSQLRGGWAVIVKTETGSIYEFEPGRVIRRRTDDAGVMRRDGEWIKLYQDPVVKVGVNMILYIEQLGSADFPFTTRMTSRVTEIITFQHESRYDR